MAAYRIAAVLNCSFGDEFLVVRQVPPPRLPEEYQKYVDSDLWDLPSAPLKPLEGPLPPPSEPVIQGADSLAGKLDLLSFDVSSAIDQVLSQADMRIIGNWALVKYLEEPEFGPEPLVHTLLIQGRLEPREENLQEMLKWMSKENALKLLLEVKPSSDRIGPLVVFGLLGDSTEFGKWMAQHTLPFQEYPPGIKLVPMRSRTLNPFRTTNLVVVAPGKDLSGLEDSRFIAYGEALIMDPGCCMQIHSQLMDLIAALPRKLVVFVTHHHHDHIDGLSVIQKSNPDAILLANERTMNRIGKGIVDTVDPEWTWTSSHLLEGEPLSTLEENWSLGCTLLSGGEKICIGDQLLEAISAPGHTDGHLALLHVSTNSLIVGDHCVGHGSAILDISAGGNMKDYFKTTYMFMELSPHVIIPMHGRINLWPKRMLCGYLKHRRDREASILRAIESGAESLFDIVFKAYGDLDIKLWFPASSNVRIHVDHLAHESKLPKDFSMSKFRASCGMHFKSRWILAYLKKWKPTSVAMLTVLGVGGLALSFAIKGKFGTRNI